MRLTELNPTWEHKIYLTFTCPICPYDSEKSRYGNCLINIPVKPQADSGWQSNGVGDFENLTLTPSIWHHCKSDPHFFITDGNIIMV